jgi:hypothetical protein
VRDNRSAAFGPCGTAYDTAVDLGSKMIDNAVAALSGGDPSEHEIETCVAEAIEGSVRRAAGWAGTAVSTAVGTLGHALRRAAVENASSCFLSE